MPPPILKTDDKGTYYAHWSEGRRSKRRSMGTKSRDEAEARFARWILLGGHKGDAISEEGKQSLTVAELWDVYNTKHVQKETAAPASIEYAWKNLSPFFGKMKIDEIDQDVIDLYEDRRETGVIGRHAKSATVRKELVALRACFNWHASPERGRRKLIEPKDLPAFTLPEDSGPRDRWLSVVEIKKLFSAAAAMHPGENRMSRGERFLWLALETAARKQALLDLTWDRVDFEIGVIDLFDPRRAETKKKRPVVPISAALMPILKHMHDQRINEHVLDNSGPIWATIQLIVINAGLSPKQKIGKSGKPKATGISPHTFRHTAATHMARRGVPLYDIAGILGNSLVMVERVYAKHCRDRLRAAVNSISAGILEAAE